MRRLFILTLLGLLGVGALSGCSKNPSSTALGSMSIKMTDAPGDFQAVNLVVREVAVQHSGGNGGWEVLSSQTQTYDLLQLRNGVFATLGISQLPAGHYNQLRLKLGSGSNVVVDNVTHPLIVPSGLQTGYKLAGSFDVPAHGRIDLALDFDAARSISRNDDGSYTLDPVARVVTINLPDNSPGGIRGVVLPADAAASVTVMQNTEIIASTLADDSGNFMVGLLPAGTYKLKFHSEHGFLDQTMDNVVVQSGQTTDAGTVLMQPGPLPPPPPPATKGTISGLVTPSGVAATASAMQGTTVVGEVPVDPEGRFLIPELPEGTYGLLIHPSADYQDASREGLNVIAGQNTDVGLIQLELIPPPPPPPPPSNGAITGQVVPMGVPTTVTALQGTTVVAQTTVDGSGNFTIDQLPPGTYSLFIHPEFDFVDSTVNGVVVNSGATTNVGQIFLQP